MLRARPSHLLKDIASASPRPHSHFPLYGIFPVTRIRLFPPSPLPLTANFSQQLTLLPFCLKPTLLSLPRLSACQHRRGPGLQCCPPCETRWPVLSPNLTWPASSSPLGASCLPPSHTRTRLPRERTLVFSLILLVPVSESLPIPFSFPRPLTAETPLTILSSLKIYLR